MRSEALKKAQSRYDEKRRKSGITKSYQIKCHVEHDADIIAVLDSCENKNGFIKDLIRKEKTRL